MAGYGSAIVLNLTVAGIKNYSSPAPRGELIVAEKPCNNPQQMYSDRQRKAPNNERRLLLSSHAHYSSLPPLLQNSDSSTLMRKLQFQTVRRESKDFSLLKKMKGFILKHLVHKRKKCTARLRRSTHLNMHAAAELKTMAQGHG